MARRRKARPHQSDALAYAFDRTAVGLFMEMRLGKSLVAIRWAESVSEDRPVLIVGPLSTLPGWQDELKAEGYTSEFIRGADYADRFWPFHQHKFWLTNYEQIRIRPDIVQLAAFDTLILDESTAIKNPKAKITKVLTDRRVKAEHRAVLSGLPNPEDPMDFFCQMKFLRGSWLGFDNWWRCRDTLFEEAPWGYVWTPKRGTLDRIYDSIHRECFCLTRKEAGLGPGKIRERRVVPIAQTQRAAYRKVEKEFAHDGGDTKHRVVAVNWLCRIAGGFTPDLEFKWPGKVNELMSLLTGELQGEQVVVWFRFNLEMRPVKAALKKARIPFVQMTGSTSLEGRRTRRLAFQRGRARVALVQEKIGRFGLDLAAADVAIYYSNSPSQQDRFQSEDRIVSIRKRESVLVLDLITEGTTDERVLQLVTDKRMQSRNILTRLVAEIRSGKGRK